MYNLEIVSHFPMVPTKTPVLGITLDEFSNTLYVINSTPSLVIHQYNPMNPSLTTKHEEFPLEVPELAKGIPIVDLTYVQEQQVLVLILRNGSVFTIDANRTVEAVAEMPEQILAAKWSPTEEYLVLATAKFLVLLDSQLNPVKETSIDDESESLEALEASISWAADGKLMGICYSTESGSKCLQRDTALKVIKGPAKADPEGGIVQSVSEKIVPGMLCKVATMPSGAFVAGIERKNEKTKVILWEKNGLRHGDFLLPENCKEVTQLDWKLEGTILAISYDSVIMLYQRMNYKWYGKMSIRVAGELCGFRWMTKKGRLLVARKNGQFSIYEVESTVSRTTHKVQEDKDFAGVVVTDTESLYVSHFDKTVIPPPMSNYQIPLPKEAAILKTCYTPKYLTCLTYDSILLFPVENYSKPFTIPFQSKPLLDTLAEYNITHFLFLEYPDSLYAILCAPSPEPEQDQIFVLTISADQIKIENILLVQSKKIVAMCPNANYIPNRKTLPSSSLINSAYFPPMRTENIDTEKYIFVQYLDKSVTALAFSMEPPFFSEFSTIPQTFTEMVAAYAGAQESIIGLTLGMKLYINSVMFSSDVTSFLVAGNLLFFTKSTPGTSHLLYVYDLLASLPLPISGSVPLPALESKSYHVRAVERSAKLVSYKKPKIIMQLPRGNLETIHPRIPVLYVIKELLEARNYKDAFLECRKHRINTNLIYDLAPDQFIKDAQTFIEQLTKTDYINLFVNGLADTICEEAKFLLGEVPNEGKVEQKTNKVCNLLIETMTKMDQNRYLLSIITCYTKQSPPALRKILEMIKELKAQETEAAKKAPPHIDPSISKKKKEITADEALEYACWLVKADHLYDIALQTYDINMVLQVAKHTQKDPKEYLPYLKSLQELEPVYRKYKIQKDLKQHNLALAELSEDKENKYAEEALELVQKHKLYEDGLKLYKENPTMHQKICLAYGEHLWGNSKYETAAAMFRLGGDLPKALDAYKKCENYPLAKSISMLMHQSKDQVMELAEEFLNIFRTSDDHRGAAIVLLDLYSHKALTGKEQIEDLVVTLVKARDYFKAIELASENDRPDLISGEIYKGVALAYDILYNDIMAALNNYNEKRKRLTVVQEKKKSMPVLTEEALPMGFENMEMYSESGKSRTSRTSKRSKSSAAKKKVPRRAVIKEGSRYEEEQIIEFLETLAPTPDTVKDVEYVGKCMEFFGRNEEAAKLDKMLKELQGLTKSTILSYEQMKVAEGIPNFFDVFPKLKPTPAPHHK